MTTTTSTGFDVAAWHADYKRRQAARAARQQSPTVRMDDLLLADVAMLARTGETLEGAARRLGYTKATALERALRRHGRPDLARTLSANSTEVVDPWQ